MAGTAYFVHSDCSLHDMGPGHPESPARMEAIADQLARSGLLDRLCTREPTPIEHEQLRRAHDPSYLARLHEIDQALNDESLNTPAIRHALDPDTSMNRHSYRSARLAAGAAVQAVDFVLEGRADNAFCVSRPPGHHAMRDRAMGFCLLSNVAIAAKHACVHHGLERVAIIDFDVHHGNGTEDIVAGDDRILMVSFYQHPFYPLQQNPRTEANLLNCPVPAGTGGAEIRELVDAIWMPRLSGFAPELVLISAGFDAHADDQMAGLMLTEGDFAWMTCRAMDIADRTAGGRVVSCLEGGYRLPALASSVSAHLEALLTA